MDIVTDKSIPTPEVLGQRRLVEVPCLHNDVLWVKFLDGAADLDRLNAEISGDCCVTTRLNEDFVASLASDMIVCASFNGSYYRAKILDYNTVVYHAQVLFVDYGNISTVDINHLRPCRLAWCRLARQAVPVRLADMAVSSYEDYTAHLRARTDPSAGHVFEARFENQLSDLFYDFATYSVQLVETATSKSLSEMLLKKDFLRLSYHSVPVEQFVNEAVALPETRLGDANEPLFKADVVIACCDGPHSFGAQLSSQSATIQMVQAYVDAHCATNCQLLYPPWVNQSVCAKYSADLDWYRARCIGVTQATQPGAEPMYEVQFVDYGNKESVGIASLKPITPALVQTPCQMLCCGLLAMTGNQEETPLPAICDKFTELVLGKTLSCGFYRRYRGSSGLWEYEVDLFLPSGERASDVMVKYSCKVHMEAGTKRLEQERQARQADASVPSHPIDERKSSVPDPLQGVPRLDKPNFEPMFGQQDAEDVCVLDVQADGTFICQLLAYAASLNGIEDRLTAKYMKEKPSMPAMRNGAACAGLYEADRRWYRATIKEQRSEWVTLEFTDYCTVQKCSRVQQLAPLPSYALDLPGQAFRCQLKGIEPYSQQGTGKEWTQASAKTLLNDLSDIRLKVTFHGVTDRVWICDLCRVSPGGKRAVLSEWLIAKGYARQSNTIPNPSVQSTVSETSNASGSQPAQSHAGKSASRTILPPKSLSLQSPTSAPLASASSRGFSDTTPSFGANRSPCCSEPSTPSLSKRPIVDVADATISVGQEYDVIICHVEEDCSFWCQIQEGNRLEKISKTLQDVGQRWMSKFKGKSVNNQRLEGLCVAALFPDDGLWYRARVLATVNQTSRLVSFVDYGNESEIMSTDVFPLSTQLRSIPAQAFACQLQSSLSPDFDQLSALCNDGTLLTCAVVGEKKDDIWTVQLKQDGQLLDESLCPSPVLPDVSKSPSVTVAAHPNSDDVFVPTRDSVETSRQGTANVNGRTLEPVIETCDCSQPYRAVIEDQTACTVTQESRAGADSLSIRDASQVQSSQQAALNGQLEDPVTSPKKCPVAFQPIVSSQSSYGVCSLPQDCRLVNVDICVARHPSVLALRFSDSIRSLLSLETDMQSLYSSLPLELSVLTNPRATDLCAVHLPSQGRWCRGNVFGISFVSQSSTVVAAGSADVYYYAEVLLVDHGNIVTVPVCDLHRLDQQFLALPTQVIQCSLDCMSNAAHDQEVLQFFLDYVVRNTQVQCMFKTHNPHQTPVKVDLFLNGTSLSDELMRRFPRRLMPICLASSPPSTISTVDSGFQLNPSVLGAVNGLKLKSPTRNGNREHSQPTTPVGEAEGVCSEILERNCDDGVEREERSHANGSNGIVQLSSPDSGTLSMSTKSQSGTLANGLVENASADHQLEDTSCNQSFFAQHGIVEGVLESCAGSEPQNGSGQSVDDALQSSNSTPAFVANCLSGLIPLARGHSYLSSSLRSGVAGIFSHHSSTQSNGQLAEHQTFDTEGENSTKPKKALQRRLSIESVTEEIHGSPCSAESSPAVKGRASPCPVSQPPPLERVTDVSDDSLVDDASSNVISNIPDPSDIAVSSSSSRPGKLSNIKNQPRDLDQDEAVLVSEDGPSSAVGPVNVRSPVKSEQGQLSASTCLCPEIGLPVEVAATTSKQAGDDDGAGFGIPGDICTSLAADTVDIQLADLDVNGGSNGLDSLVAPVNDLEPPADFLLNPDDSNGSGIACASVESASSATVTEVGAEVNSVSDTQGLVVPAAIAPSVEKLVDSKFEALDSLFTKKVAATLDSLLTLPSEMSSDSLQSFPSLEEE